MIFTPKKLSASSGIAAKEAATKTALQNPVSDFCVDAGLNFLSALVFGRKQDINPACKVRKCLTGTVC